MTTATLPRMMPDYRLPFSDCSNVALVLDYQMADCLAAAFADARADIFIVQYQFRITQNPRPEMRRVIHALRAAADRGIPVRILLNHPVAENQQRQDHGTLFTTLQHPNVAIRHHTSQRILHSKLTVIDGALTILGSHNYSQPSLATSRNLSVIITAPSMAQRILRVYNQIWLEASVAPC